MSSDAIGTNAKKITKGTKIRLLPTKEQENLFWRSAGTARWAYNYFLSENERVYNDWLANGQTGKKYISEGDVRKHINNVLKKTTHTWLREIGSNVMKQAVKDANLAMQRFFSGLSGYPKYKSRHKSKISFYVNYESLKKTQNGFRGEKIGFVKTASPLPKIGKDKKYVNPHISYDGRYWYLSVGYDVATEQVELTTESIGIDLGIKDLAIIANTSGELTDKVKNINKTSRVKKLKKRLRRMQRKVSRKLEKNIKGYTKNRRPIWKTSLKQCQNIQKQNNIIRRIHKHLNDIRNNHVHQATSAIVKLKPYRIVMEDLNVKGAMKNRHLSKAIDEQKWYEFKRQIQYKAEMHGIAFVEADRWYASSKTCSHCGYVKKDLKLSDRIYRCPSCGAIIDRDINAAINLANYNLGASI